MSLSHTNAPVGAAAGHVRDAVPDVPLPRPPGVFRRWLAAHPGVVDWTIIGTYLFGCALMILLSVALRLFWADPDTVDVPQDAADEIANSTAFLSWPWIVVVLLVIAATAVALKYRRKYPLVGLVVVAVLLVIEQGTLIVPNSIALLFLLYAVPVYRGVAAGWIGYAAVVALNTAQIFLFRATPTGAIGPTVSMLSSGGEIGFQDAVVLSILNALWLLAILMIAINLGNRRRYVEALIDRAHQLAREREQQAELSAAAERSRIAREMHDIVAHSLSVVVTLSEAASVAVETQPAAAKRAMERAAETGRSALVEMRRLLGVLNDGGASSPGPSDAEPVGAGGPAAAPRAPQPGLAQLHELVDGFRQAGLRVSVTESGVPVGDATHQLAVYRIVQEGLTNALRYAGRGARAQLSIAHGVSGTNIEIVDSGPIGTTAGTAGRSGGGDRIPGSGRGLDGARERARMFGGMLDAGPSGSGWRLAAEVPLDAGRVTNDEDEGDDA